jgi:hypothetical protein
VSAVALGALAALGGAYPSATIPILSGAALAFLASGARVGSGDTRALDLSLVALAAGVLLQLVPLPAGLTEAMSPHLDTLRDGLRLDAGGQPTTLSVDPRLTRGGLASLVSALLLFWAAREVFSRRGVRTAARAIAWSGFALTVMTLVQRVTAPDRLMWQWTPVDPGSQPFGPFVNRNHLGTWLIMATALTAGYLVAHTRSHAQGPTALRLRVRDWLADGNGLFLSGAIAIMLLGIVATLSRAAILGTAAALAAGTAIGGVHLRGRVARVAVAAAAILLATAVWSNREGLARKFDSVTTVSRLEIWQETFPVVRDFWLTGTGTGTYGPAMLRYQERMREVHLNQAHSEYVQLAAEGGLLLLVPCALAAFAAVRLAHRRMKDDTRAMAWLRVGAAAGLAGVAVQGLFETGLRIPANALLAALLAAILLHDSRPSAPRES